MQVDTSVQLPLAIGLNVCDKIQGVHTRSEERVGAANCCVPAAQVLTAEHAVLDESLLNVDPATHDAHDRSVDNVGAAV